MNGYEQILNVMNILFDYYIYLNKLEWAGEKLLSFLETLWRLTCCLSFFKRYYRLQSLGYSYENVEILLRKINPKYFTLSQHTLKEIVEMRKAPSSKQAKNKLEMISNFACFSAMGQNSSIPGIAGSVFIRLI